MITAFRCKTCLFLLPLLFCSAPFLSAQEYDFTAVPIGDLRIYPLRDADVTMESRLVPDLDKFPEYKGLFKNGPVPAVCQTYFFRNGDRNILIDSGWGHEMQVKGNTLKILQASGISPDSITDILLTHLDMDHIGGLMENGKAVFPNATLRIAAPEAKAWREGAIERRPDAARKRALDLWNAYAGRIKLFEHGQEILPGVHAVDASGHTPGHTAFDIVSGRDKLTVAGDIMHIYQLQLPKPEISTVYDMDMQKAAETRQKLLQRASEDKSAFAGMHFPMIGDVQRRPDGGFMMREPR